MILSTPKGIALSEIIETGILRLGMCLNFEGLSFKVRGKLQGLEVELARLLAEEMGKILHQPIRLKVIDQEWSQILDMLRERKYHAIFSALIPSSMYQRFFVQYTRPYLYTGIVNVAPLDEQGHVVGGVTKDASSLKDKTIVIINDPAARRGLRRAGIYIEQDAQQNETSIYFPRHATLSEIEQAKKLEEKYGMVFVPPQLIPVTTIIQLDEMSLIYDLLVKRKVDAGVIDLGIIWWVASQSPRYAPYMKAYTHPIAKYIYSAVTNITDPDLHQILDEAIATMYTREDYKKIVKQWHGGELWQWSYDADDFVDL